ncbi:MAG: extracellular solute-binding protein [Xanthobacteraceae bacterium]
MQRSESRTRFNRTIGVNRPARRTVAALLCLAGAIATGACLEFGLPRAHAASTFQSAYGIAMIGQPALPPDFSHLPYVNPDAPKGGRLVFGLPGTFDSLNPFIVKGAPVQQIRGYVVESLLARGQDEPFTLYGLLAQSLDTDDARSFVTFHLDPRARFSDGTPVTAEDVLFSWQLLRDKGRPNHQIYYSQVARAEAPDPLTVRFDFGGVSDRELPLILGLMPILPHHAIDPARFEETSLAPPLGSGPYRVSAVRAGASLTLTRNPDYWARDLPINRGLWNFDEVRIDFYREANGAFEAFKRGLYDFRREDEPLRWHEGYDFPAARRGEVVRDEIVTGLPKPAEFLVFNTRRAVFADIRVRQALSLLFDFEWVNRNYWFGLYSRAAGFFPGSELSAYGQPASTRERELLRRFDGVVRPDVLDGTWRLPVSDGSGRDRTTLSAALKLLAAAGYELDGMTLRNRATKAPLAFELLVTTRDQERIALAYANGARRAGVAVTVRAVDAVQFDQRRLAYDFDMIENRWDQSLSPGNEQSFYWGTAAADIPGTRNYMGVREPAVDAMIAAMLEARDRPDFVAAVRALDRILISGCYAIPLYHVEKQWIARWNRIQQPQTRALSGYLPETWWQTPAAHGP